MIFILALKPDLGAKAVSQPGKLIAVYTSGGGDSIIEQNSLMADRFPTPLRLN
jgi:hypothetical protein